MLRLRILSEAECYSRLYGRPGESSIHVVARTPTDYHAFDVTGEELRALLEERLDAREPGVHGEEAA